MSGLANALIINGVVLAAVLEADLGPHRKIGAFRIVRPLLTAGVVVPIYLTGFASSGTGLTLEIAAAVAGLVAGLLATALMRVYRSPRTGRAVTRAGFGYAALWTGIVAARTAFSYGSAHWFSASLGDWMARNAVTADAVTDSLLLMAIAMMLTRTIGLTARAATLPAPAPTAAPRATRRLQHAA
jgi:hypothetical protein